MTKTIRTITLALAGTLAGAAAVHAQTPAPGESQILMSVSLGGQFGKKTFNETTSFPLYNELATVSNSQQVGNGFVFDISGAYRVRRHFALALGISTFHGSGDASLTATIPSPIFFGQPKVSTGTEGSLGQTDVAVNLQAVWLQPITSKIDAAIFAGPSIIHVKQTIGTATAVPGTQDISTLSGSESKTTGKAGSVGVDFNYKINPRYGAGLFVRYLGGRADLPSVKLTVGGAQVGVGLRVAF
jgi:hypothetical protein